MNQSDTNILKTINDIIKNARNIFPSTSEPWRHLKHGTELLKSENELNAYIAAYWEPHKQKVLKAFELLELDKIKGPFEICDWGCGQGLATMCLLAKLIARNLLSNLQAIHLVEPGQPALEKAEFNIKPINPELKIECINKGLPSANAPFECISEITFEQPVVIHLFSNILDIENINLEKVADLVVASGNSHYVVCIGPANRNEVRYDNFYNHFQNKNTINDDLSITFKDTKFFKDDSYNNHLFGCFIKIFRVTALLSG